VKFLAKITDAFQLIGGLTVITDITFDHDLRMKSKVELHRPDGSIVQTEAFRNFLDPSAEEHPISITFPDLHKEDVPIGTEIWLLNSDEAVLEV
jgi:hypothetical protein